MAFLQDGLAHAAAASSPPNPDHPEVDLSYPVEFCLTRVQSPPDTPRPRSCEEGHPVALRLAAAFIEKGEPAQEILVSLAG